MKNCLPNQMDAWRFFSLSLSLSFGSAWAERVKSWAIDREKEKGFNADTCRRCCCYHSCCCWSPPIGAFWIRAREWWRKSWPLHADAWCLKSRPLAVCFLCLCQETSSSSELSVCVCVWKANEMKSTSRISHKSTASHLISSLLIWLALFLALTRAFWSDFILSLSFCLFLSSRLDWDRCVSECVCLCAS